MMAEIATGVSIIIPCYNAERWIARTIESVLGQKRQGAEVIVVDDGSSDRTAHILKGFGADITVITQSNAGVSAARNHGASCAAGEFIKFLDADDVLPEGALASLAKAADAYPGKVIVGRAQVIDELGFPYAGEIGYNIGCRPESGMPVNPWYLITQATHSSLWLIPKRVFLDSGGFEASARLGEEFWFTARLLQCGAQFVFLDSDISHVRNHDGERLSRDGKQDDYIRQLGKIEECVSYLSRRSEFPPDARLQISRMCWSAGRQCVRLHFRSASAAHFAYARRVSGGAAINGSFAYRVLLWMFGPNHAEALLEVAKRLSPGYK